MKTEWRKIGNYMVSEKGHVLKWYKEGRFEKPGYYAQQVGSDLVHRLVCCAFHGPPKKRQEVHHIDGNPSNNQKDNLMWHDPSHRGLQGPQYKRRKLSREQVEEIKVLKKKGMSTYTLAKKFGVSEPTIRRELKIGRFKDCY